MSRKKKILIATLIAWVIFSAGYIAYDLGSKFLFKQMNHAFAEGRRLTIEQLIKSIAEAD